MYTCTRKTPVALLFFCGFVSGFCYFGLLSTLLLKLHQDFSLSDNSAYSLLGLYTGLTFSLLLPSGYISDRYLGTTHALRCGVGLLFIGSLLLLASQLNIFNIGLGFFIVGLSLVKVNCINLISQIKQQQHQPSEKYFSYYYSSINIGAMISPMIIGWIAAHWGWRHGFLLFSPLLLLLLRQITAYSRDYRCHAPVKIRLSVIIPCLILAALLCGTIFINAHDSQLFFMILMVFSSILFIKALHNARAYRRQLGIILALCLCSMLFFMVSLQINASLTLFIERDLPRQLGGLTIPSSAFSALDPLFVCLSAPLLISIWQWCQQRGHTVTLRHKIFIGLYCGCLTLLILVLVATLVLHQQPHMAMLLIVIANFFIGVGEMCLTPAILSAIASYSPPQLRTTLIGSWYLFVAMAGYLASQFAKLASQDATIPIDPMISTQHYQQSFFEMTLIACCVVVLIYRLRSYLSMGNE